MTGKQKEAERAKAVVFPRRSLDAPRYSRFKYQNLDVTYVCLDRGTEPEHEHASLQVSIALGRQPLVALERKSTGVSSKKLLLKGNSCIVPQWQRHTFTWNQRSEWVSFHLAPHYVTRAAMELDICPSSEIVACFGANDKSIFQLGYRLGTMLRREDLPPQLFVESLAAKLVERLFRGYAANKNNLRFFNGGLTPHKLRRVVDYIDAHLASDLVLDELAASIDLSSFHFARAFKTSTGLTPHQFVVNRRMENAGLMLADKRMSIGEVARAVGYSSHSCFSRLFQKHTAYTPRRFRELF